MNQGQKLLLAAGALGLSGIVTWMDRGAKKDFNGFATIWIPMGIAVWLLFGALTK